MPDFGLSRAIRQAVMRGARGATVKRPGQEALEAMDDAVIDAITGDMAPVAPVTPDHAAPPLVQAVTPPPVAAAPGAPVVPATQPPSMLDTLPPRAISASPKTVSSLDFGAYNLDETFQTNFDTITTTDEVKAVIADTASRNAGRIDEARRGAITNDQLKVLSAELDIREDIVRAVMERESGGALNAETIFGARQVLNSSAKRIYDLGKKITVGQADDLERLQFRRQMMWHADFQTQFMGARAETGRALNAFSIPADTGNIDFAAMRDLVENMNGYDTDRLARLAVLTDGNTKSVTQAARKYTQSKAAGVVNELFINSILSGPATHIVNTTGSVLFQGMNIIETAWAARIGRFLPGNEHAQAGEASALLHGTIGAYRDGLKLAGVTMRNGIPLDDVVKFEGLSRRSISAQGLLSAEQLDTPIGRFSGALIDSVGAVVRAPTERVMAPTDELFKTLAYRAELQRLALRHVSDQLVNTPNMDVATAEQMAREFMEDAPLSAQQASTDYARYVTFQNALGPTGQKWQLAIRNTPGGFLIAPFVRTPVNLFKAGILDRSPLGFFSKRFRDTMRAGGRERDMMLARLSMGTATSAVVASYAAEGLITGGGPQNPEQRRLLEATGWRPYSIKVTNPVTGAVSYNSYARLEPLAFVIGATADAVEISAYINADADGMENEDSFVLHSAAAIITGIANNTTSKTFVKGIVDFSELMSDPARYMEGWSRNAASGLVPYSSFRAEAGQLQDPYLREAWTVLDQLKIRSGIPGYSEDAPVSRDVFGQPRRQAEGLILGTMSPFPVSRAKDDLIINEVVDVMQTSHTVPVTMPGKRIDGMRLRAEEYERLVVMSRLEPAPNGLTFKDALGRIMTSSTYLQATADYKSELIRDVQERYDAVARRRLEQEDPGFLLRLTRHRENDNRMLRGF